MRTVGSISREDAARIFPFLSPRLGGLGDNGDIYGTVADLAARAAEELPCTP